MFDTYKNRMMDSARYFKKVLKRERVQAKKEVNSSNNTDNRKEVKK